MKRVGVFYGSTTGKTAEVAEKIAVALDYAPVKDIAEASKADLEAFDVLVIGTSTWGAGDLQDDWEGFDLSSLDLNGKQVAIFGLGDADGYADTFVDGMGVLYDAVTARGAEVIGAWSTDGYEFDESAAVTDGRFVGLVIDEDNQDELTDGRVEAWTARLKGSL